MKGHKPIATAEIKFSNAPTLSKGYHQSIEETHDLPFDYQEVNLYSIGGLKVMDRYQTDPNDNQAFAPIERVGDPQPGDTVRLTYRILPGTSTYVQGVRIEVVARARTNLPPVAADLPPTSTPTANASSRF